MIPRNGNAGLAPDHFLLFITAVRFELDEHAEQHRHIDEDAMARLIWAEPAIDDLVAIADYSASICWMPPTVMCSSRVY